MKIRLLLMLIFAVAGIMVSNTMLSGILIILALTLGVWVGYSLGKPKYNKLRQMEG